MKIFFASLTDLSLEVDAWVPTVEQGLTLIRALSELYKDHAAVFRARFKRFENYEERYIGPAWGDNFDAFVRRVERMGDREPNQGDRA